MNGIFITFEGIDGAGKSTHLHTLTHHLTQQGRAVCCTREPGGTPLAEHLREQVLNTPMDSLTEVLLMFAARRDHLSQVIEPALQRGTVVLCDRFTDATFAYQGAGRGFPLSTLNWLEQQVHPHRQPDITLWFDVPAAIAAERRGAARHPDRFEQLDEAFFERVRGGYAQRAELAPERFVHIAAQNSVQEVWHQVWQEVSARLGSR